MKTKLLSTVTHFVILTKVLIFSRTLYFFQLMGGCLLTLVTLAQLILHYHSWFQSYLLLATRFNPELIVANGSNDSMYQLQKTMKGPITSRCGKPYLLLISLLFGMCYTFRIACATSLQLCNVLIHTFLTDLFIILRLVSPSRLFN